jgi:hypothetical protein
MSTLKVDSLVEKTSGNGVHIPGHVIQVVEGSASGSALIFTDINNSHLVDSLTITTKSANSKILVSGGFTFQNGNNTSFVCMVHYGGSEVYRFGEFSKEGRYAAFGSFLHSPNVAAGTTITYETRAAKESSNSGTTMVINQSHDKIILQEIAQ